ncbi:MAG TPA: aspartate aminotransferase, partial [Thermoleophilia bacterium]|nr:aspartate aminotransferase [Thermoleophilia bacterium]
MRLDPFQLERYFGDFEFTVPRQLSVSDCDGLGMNELLALADDETRALWDGLALGYTETQGHPL